MTSCGYTSIDEKLISNCTATVNNNERSTVEQQTAPVESAPMTSPKVSDTPCCVCFDIPVIRGIIPCCDHIFCYDCILKWSKQTNKCPICKQRFNQVTSFCVDNLSSDNGKTKAKGSRGRKRPRTKVAHVQHKDITNPHARPPRSILDQQLAFIGRPMNFSHFRDDFIDLEIQRQFRRPRLEQPVIFLRHQMSLFQQLGDSEAYRTMEPPPTNSRVLPPIPAMMRERPSSRVHAPETFPGTSAENPLEINTDSDSDAPPSSSNVQDINLPFRCQSQFYLPPLDPQNISRREAPSNMTSWSRRHLPQPNISHNRQHEAPYSSSWRPSTTGTDPLDRMPFNSCGHRDPITHRGGFRDYAMEHNAINEFYRGEDLLSRSRLPMRPISHGHCHPVATRLYDGFC